MASALIQERGTVSGNQFRMSRPIEDAAQVFLAGTPLQINNATGGLKAWDGVTIAAGLAGIGKENGANLSTAGVPLNSPAGTAPGALYVGGGQAQPGAIQNEPNAVAFSRPFFNDGRTGVVLAIPDTVFYGQVGPNQVTAITDIGKQYGLTKDVDGHWYVDKTKTGANAVLTVTGLDAFDTTRGVLFTFLPAVSQLPS
jgi:hypothetical protein